MSEDARMNLRLSEDLLAMTRAVAKYEGRTVSNVTRRALTLYFEGQGYFDPDFIEQVAPTKGTK